MAEGHFRSTPVLLIILGLKISSGLVKGFLGDARDGLVLVLVLGLSLSLGCGGCCCCCGGGGCFVAGFGEEVRMAAFEKPAKHGAGFGQDHVERFVEELYLCDFLDGGQVRVPLEMLFVGGP